MESHIIDIETTLLEALRRLNALSGSLMTLFVVERDDNGVPLLRGTLTDGDIRRALLSGVETGDPVSRAIHRNYHCISADNPYDIDTIRTCRRKGIMLVPVVDSRGSIVEILDLSKRRTRLPLRAILMAGGKGERLRPLTLTTPKPLLEIDGKAIIDYNVEALAAVGIDDITVTTRYLADKIIEHFAHPIAGVQVKCVVEDRPLGTIGAATLVDIPAEGNTLVMNSDLLSTISFEDMYMQHIENDADITIGAIPYQVSVPYAILATNPDNGLAVTGIEEKPSYSYYANAGIYIFSNKILRDMPRDTRVDATELIEKAIAEGRKVTYFTINGTWIDVGSPTDFRQAGELMRHHHNLNSHLPNK